MSAPDDLRGVLVRDPRVSAASLDPTLTTADQAGPIPGAFEPQRPSKMVLRSGGAMSPGESITVNTVRGGYPGVDSRAAGFTYEHDGEEYGWDPPGYVHGVDLINFRRAAAAAQSAFSLAEPSLCKLPDGRVLMAAHRVGALGLTLVVHRFDPAVGLWPQVATIVHGFVNDSETKSPCMVVMPDGRIHLYAAGYAGAYDGPSAAHDVVQVALWISDDAGDTWVESSRECLLDPDIVEVDSRLHRLCAAQNAGQVVLFAHHFDPDGDSSGPRQYASADGGYRFKRQPTDSPAYPNWDDQSGDGLSYFAVVGVVPTDNGGFLVAYRGGATELIIAEIGSAFDWINGRPTPSEAWRATPGPLVLAKIGIADLFGAWGSSLWRGEDGSYNFLVWENLSTDGSVEARATVYRSTTARRGSFTAFALPSLSNDNGNLRLEHQNTVETRGMCVTVGETGVPYTVEGVSGLDSGSIVALYHGGHTNVTLPGSVSVDRDDNRWAPTYTYWPVDLPGGLGWTTLGAGTSSLEVTGLTVSCTDVQNWYMQRTIAQVNGDELVVEFDGADLDGASDTGTVNQPRCGIRVECAQASEQLVTVIVNVGENGVSVYEQGGALLGTIDGDFSGRWSIRLAMLETRYACWARIHTTPTERTWVLVAEGDDLTPSGSGETSHEIRVGTISGTGSTTVSYAIERVAVGLLPDDTSTLGVLGSPLYPRYLARRPAFLPSGVSLEAVDGPTVPGDSWVVETAYQYGFGALDVDSPAVTWRSTVDDTAMDLVWDLTGYADDSRLMAPSIALALLGSNLRSYTLTGRTAAGADTVLVAAVAEPFASGWVVGIFSLSRNGQVFSGTTVLAGAQSRWLQHDELAGCRLVTATGEGFTIASNTSGQIGGQGARKQAQIRVTGDASGLASTITAHIHPRDTATWRHGITTDFRWLKLSIPAQVTAEGYYEIGSLVLGPLHVFGREYSWDTLRERAENVELRENRDGSRVTRELGAQRRACQLAWREGVDESDVYRDFPQLVVTSDGAAVAVAADTPRLVEGLYSQVGGSRDTIVYLPAVPRSVASGCLNERRALLYARIMSTFSQPTIIGHELHSEVVRINELRLEEEL